MFCWHGHPNPAALLALTVVLVMATAAAAQLQVVQQQMNQAVMEPDVDFGAQLAEEVVDLNTAHSSTEDAEAKDMQSLLNWAIGGHCTTGPSGQCHTILTPFSEAGSCSFTHCTI